MVADSAAQLLRSYLPEHLVPRLAAGDFPPPGQAETVWAVTLFSDVSGFTPLSEALTRLGKEGSERLSTTLVRHFTHMVEIIEAHGGSVIKYGGDAAAVLFLAAPADDRSELALRALRCARAMMNAIEAYSNVPVPELGENFLLRMKIGLACGDIRQLLVGDAERTEYVAAGRPCDRMAEAEHHAEAGEIVAAAELVAALGKPEWFESRADGFARLHGDPGCEPPRSAVLPQALDIALTRGFVHPVIAQQLLATGGSVMLGEHRKCTTMFVMFEGLEYDSDPDAFSKLHAYFRHAYGVLHRYGGHLNQLATGDKGSVLHVIFGAPASYENDEERAVRAAIELRESKPSFIAAQRIGVNTGSVFGGNIGSDRRREYTALGDATNLAARLMAKAAPDQVLCSESTRERTEGIIEYQSLPRVTVKGKLQSIAIFDPRRPRTRAGRLTETRSRLIGRQSELSLLESQLARLGSGHGGWIHLDGDPGVGKTRLIEELPSLLPNGAEIHVGRAESWSRHREFAVWADILLARLDLDSEAAPDERRKRLTAEIGRAPALELGAALDWWPPTWNQTMADGVYRQRIEAAFEAALLPPDRAGVIVLEGLHWIDPSSRALLERLGGSLADVPWQVITTGRPPCFEPRWVDRFGVVVQPLGPLSREDLADLVRELLDQAHIDPEMMELLVQRSQGNPLFAGELVRRLRQSGAMERDRESGRWFLAGTTAAAALPESVNDVVLARLDVLPELARQVIRTASVLGETFAPSLLAKVLPLAVSSEDVLRALQELVHADLVAPVEKERWAFRQGLVRDVAYESLGFAQRRGIHRSVAVALEADGSASAAMLAEHWDAAQEPIAALSCHDRAWREAVDAHRNREAFHHLSSALRIGEQVGLAAARRMQLLDVRARTAIRLGDATTAFADQKARFELAHRQQDRQVMAEAAYRLSRISEKQGWHRRASRAAAVSARLAASAGWSDGRDRGLVQAAVSQWRSGNAAEAERQLRELIPALSAKSLGGRARLALGAVLDSRGQRAQAQTVLTEALAGAGDDDQALAIDALVNLAISAHGAGESDAAERHLADAAARAEQIGDRARHLVIDQDRAAIAVELGRFELAQPLLEDIAYRARRLGLTEEEARARVNLGVVAWNGSRWPEAIDRYRQALRLFAASGSGEDLLARANLVEVLLASGDPSARSELDELIVAADGRGDHRITDWARAEREKLGRIEIDR